MNREQLIVESTKIISQLHFIGLISDNQFDASILKSFNEKSDREAIEFFRSLQRVNQSQIERLKSDFDSFFTERRMSTKEVIAFVGIDAFKRMYRARYGVEPNPRHLNVD